MVPLSFATGDLRDGCAGRGARRIGGARHGWRSARVLHPSGSATATWRHQLQPLSAAAGPMAVLDAGSRVSCADRSLLSSDSGDPFLGPDLDRLGFARNSLLGNRAEACLLGPGLFLFRGVYSLGAGFAPCHRQDEAASASRTFSSARFCRGLSARVSPTAGLDASDDDPSPANGSFGGIVRGSAKSLFTGCARGLLADGGRRCRGSDGPECVSGSRVATADDRRDRFATRGCLRRWAEWPDSQSGSCLGG